jgi:hypothetical protein
MTVPAGSTEGCEGGLEGLKDMLGSVGEWLEVDADQLSTDSYRKFRAQSLGFNGPLDQDCSPRCAGNQRTFRNFQIGCRCCADPVRSHSIFCDFFVIFFFVLLHIVTHQICFTDVNS